MRPFLLPLLLTTPITSDYVYTVLYSTATCSDAGTIVGFAPANFSSSTCTSLNATHSASASCNASSGALLSNVYAGQSCGGEVLQVAPGSALGSSGACAYYLRASCAVGAATAPAPTSLAERLYRYQYSAPCTSSATPPSGALVAAEAMSLAGTYLPPQGVCTYSSSTTSRLLLCGEWGAALAAYYDTSCLKLSAYTLLYTSTSLCNARTDGFSGAYTYQCFGQGSPNPFLPSTSPLIGPFTVSYSTPCPSASDSAALPTTPPVQLTPLLSSEVFYPSCTATQGGLYVRTLCGSWGVANVYFSDSACTSATVATRYRTATEMNTCITSASSASTVQCFGTPSASPFLGCGGVEPSAPLQSDTLSCYIGVVSTSSASTSFLALMPGYSACTATTLACSAGSPNAGAYPCEASNTPVRFYGGTTGTSASPQLPGSTGLRCTTQACNSLTLDKCALSGAQPYTSIFCADSPGSKAPLTPASAAIPCYSNIPSGAKVPVLQGAAVPGALACAAYTLNCDTYKATANASDTLLKACTASGSSVMRIYGDTATLAFATSSFSFLYSVLAAPASPMRTTYSELALCATAGCNSPTADTCALAAAPIQSSVSLAGLPSSAVLDAASGNLSAAGLRVLQASLGAALNAGTACSACTVTIMRVTNALTGAVLYTGTSASAARLLQPPRQLQAATSTLAVTFAASGASASALSTVSSQLVTSPSTFLAAMSAALAAQGGAGFASIVPAIVAASAPSPSPTSTPAPTPTPTATLSSGASPSGSPSPGPSPSGTPSPTHTPTAGRATGSASPSATPGLAAAAPAPDAPLSVAALAQNPQLLGLLGLVGLPLLAGMVYFYCCKRDRVKGSRLVIPEGSWQYRQRREKITSTLA